MGFYYRAFISYRHTDRDEAVAKKLHTLIENYHIPSDIRKRTGISKMGRVFRDQEELPLSTDLGNDIRNALYNSEWLIVIASPRYLQSKWCKAELDYFISLGRRDHILVILAVGEPYESFPQELRFMSRNGQVTEVEPLAGDVRAADIKEVNRKLQTEKLRLLAPMLGVTFDDLAQRARKRRNRIVSLVTASVITVLSGFLVYALLKNAQITEQRNIAMDNQMQVLIEQANISSDEGNKLYAGKLLLEAAELRKTVGGKNDEKLLGALEYALYNQEFETILTIDNESRKFDSLVFSNNDRYLLSITNLNSACLIDATTGKVKFTVSRNVVGQLDSVGFTRDDRYFYMLDTWYGYISLYDTETGELYREIKLSEGMAWSIGEKAFPLDDGRMVIVKPASILIWDYVHDNTREIFPVGEGTVDSYTQPLIVGMSEDRQRLVVGSHGHGGGMFVGDLTGTTFFELEHDPQRGYMYMQFSDDGSRIAATSGNMYYVWDAVTGKVILKDTFKTEYDGTQKTLLNSDGTVLLTMGAQYLGAIEVDTGNVLWEKTTRSNIITEAYLSPDGRYVSCAGGISGVYELVTGRELGNRQSAMFSHDSSMIIVDPYDTEPEILVAPGHSLVDRIQNFSEELYSSPRYTLPEGDMVLPSVHVSGDYYSTPPVNADRKSQVYVSEDRKYAALTHYDGAVEVFDITDLNDIKLLTCMAEHCFESVNDLVFSGDLMATAGGHDGRCVIFDLSKGQISHIFAGEGYLYSCEFSEDGEKILLLTGSSGEKALVYSVVTGNLLYSFEAPEGRYFERVGFTFDGTMAAAVCSDGEAVTGDIAGNIDELVTELSKKYS